MPLKVCVLASGSSGNCMLVESADTGVLIDAGLSGRETARRIQEAGSDMSRIRAVCLTHEHGDHVSGLAVLHSRHGLALYANAGTIEGIELDPDARGLPWNVFATGSSFEIGDLRFESFSVPHDSYDPVGFVVVGGDARVGVVTDIGVSTTAVRERLRHCQVLVVEANHDEELLKAAKRPWALKQRILSRQGHLSNAQAADLLADIGGPHLQAVLLVHLSSECNEPHLAARAVRQRLDGRGFGHVRVELTYADRISAVVACG